MRNLRIATEAFSSGRKNYFLDFMKMGNQGSYIRICRSDEQDDGTYKKSYVVVFEEDFYFLISALSSLFHSAAHADEQDKTIADLFRLRKTGAVSGINLGIQSCNQEKNLFSTVLNA